MLKAVVIVFACVLWSASEVRASRIGDTYPQVIAERGAPRSQMDAGPNRILNYPDAVIKLRDNVVVSIRPVAPAPATTPVPSRAPAAPPSVRDQIASVKKRMDDAIRRTEAIINQEVTPVPRPPYTQLWEFYFHDGATRPDFNAVDIRRTQETTDYDPHEYIAWKDRPDVMWPGKELEFNSMTKYFYRDRSLPKKRLTEDEMVEINALYRVIGQCEQQLGQLGYTGPVP